MMIIENHRKTILKAGLSLVVSTGLLMATNSTVIAEGGRNRECEHAQVRGYTQGSGSQMRYQAPNGKNVEGVCLKSGTFMFGDGHSDSLGNGEHENGCYRIEGIGTQNLTVTKLQDGPHCQDISHLDVYLNAAQEEPEPTPTDDPEKPTPTPKPDQPTPTQKPEDPTPTPGDNNEENQNENHDCHDCGNYNPSQSSQINQVLGSETTQLADTGNKNAKMALIGSALAFLQFASGMTIKRFTRQ